MISQLLRIPWHLFHIFPDICGPGLVRDDLTIVPNISVDAVIVPWSGSLFKLVMLGQFLLFPRIFQISYGMLGPGTRNNILMEFEIQSNFTIPLFTTYSADNNGILQTSRQWYCRDVWKFSLWPVEHVSNKSTANFDRMSNSIEIPLLVGRAPGLKDAVTQLERVKGVRYPLKIEEIVHSVTTYIKLKWPCLAIFCGHGCGRSEALSSFWYLIENLAKQWSCSPHSNTHKIHPVAHPRGRTMRCLLSAQRLTHVFAELFPISRDLYTAI